MSYLKQDLWIKYVKGWLITDCAVRDRNIIYLCLREDLPEEQASSMWDHDIQTRQMAIYLDTPDDQYAVRTLIGYNKPKLGVSVVPKAQSLLVARNNDGQVSVFGGGRNQPDEFIDRGKVPMPYRIKTLMDGYAYSVGGQRKIYKRTDIGKWVRILDLPRSEHIERVGFDDMDAFSESDMYAVGGHGDVWHFDGTAWKQMGFPSNVTLGTVTCAGDGNVYISGEGGSLWVGQKSTWKRIYKGGSSILWNDVLWFDGKLWLASDYQLRIWDGKELVEVKDKDGTVPIYGHMDARDGLLAVASPWAVMTFDGKEWRTIVAPYTD